MVSLIKRLLLGLNTGNKPTITVTSVRRTLLYKLCSLVEVIFHCKYDAALFKAMMLFLYHGCLRFSEMGKSSDVRHALRIQNVSFITERGNTSLSFTLESYKYSSGPVTFRMNKTEDLQFCPV